MNPADTQPQLPQPQPQQYAAPALNPMPQQNYVTNKKPLTGSSTAAVILSMAILVLLLAIAAYGFVG